MAGRPRDPIQLAKLIGDIATGQTEDSLSEKRKNPLVKGRVGGLVGGRTRSEKLSPKQRAEIAQKAAKARWKKSK